MALRETLELDLGRAQQEIDDLERALDRLAGTIAVDLDVQTRGLDSADRESEELRRELGRVEDAADRVADEGDRIGREYKEGTDKAEKGLAGMGRAMKGFIAIAATGLVVDRIVDFGKAAVTAASDLAESTSKAEVVFGSFSDQIFEFTENAPAALRLSTQEALEMTGTFGNLFIALGLSQEAAADLAPDIVQLGADLGSFNNIPVGEVLEKLRAGLVGEAEPLRALGVNLDAATTKAKAFELGLADANGVVDAAGLVQARWALILEQTGTAQGDAARTADTFAGATATLAAEWENFQAKIGEAFLPALVELLPQLSDALADLAPALISAAEGFVALFDATEGGVSLGEVFTGVTSGLGQTIDLFKTAGIGAVGFAQLVTLQFGDAAGSFKKFGDQISDFRENLATRVSLQALVGDIAEGRDATDALADALLGLSKAGPDALSENFAKFAAVSGVAASEVEKLQRYMLANPEIFELSTREIEFLTRANRDLNFELLEGTAGFFHQGDAARLHGRALAEARAEAADASDTFELTAEQLDGMTVAAQNAAAAFRDDLVDEMKNFLTFFDEVPDEIDITLEQMEKNFEERLAVMERFWGGLDTLAKAGYTDLVATLRQEGPGAVLVVEELAADLGEAARFEEMIDAGAESIGELATSITNALGIEEAAFAAAFFEAGEAMAGGLQAALTGSDRLAAWIDMGYTIADAIKYGIVQGVSDLNVPTPSFNLIPEGFGGGTTSEQRTTGGTVVNIDARGTTTPDFDTSVAKARQVFGAVGGFLE